MSGKGKRMSTKLESAEKMQARTKHSLSNHAWLRTRDFFSDGIEKDFLEFNSGAQAVIGIAERKGVLVE